MLGEIITQFSLMYFFQSLLSFFNAGAAMPELNAGVLQRRNAATPELQRRNAATPELARSSRVVIRWSCNAPPCVSTGTPPLPSLSSGYVTYVCLVGRPFQSAPLFFFFQFLSHFFPFWNRFLNKNQKTKIHVLKTKKVFFLIFFLIFWRMGASPLVATSTGV